MIQLGVITPAAAFSAALLGVRTANTGFAALFRFVQISDDAADDSEQEENDDNI